MYKRTRTNRSHETPEERSERIRDYWRSVKRQERGTDLDAPTRPYTRRPPGSAPAATPSTRPRNPFNDPWLNKLRKLTALNERHHARALRYESFNAQGQAQYLKDLQAYRTASQLHDPHSGRPRPVAPTPYHPEPLADWMATEQAATAAALAAHAALDPDRADEYAARLELHQALRTLFQVKHRARAIARDYQGPRRRPTAKLNRLQARHSALLANRNRLQALHSARLDEQDAAAAARGTQLAAPITAAQHARDNKLQTDYDNAKRLEEEAYALLAAVKRRFVALDALDAQTIDELEDSENEIELAQIYVDQALEATRDLPDPPTAPLFPPRNPNPNPNPNDRDRDLVARAKPLNTELLRGAQFSYAVLRSARDGFPFLARRSTKIRVKARTVMVAHPVSGKRVRVLSRDLLRAMIARTFVPLDATLDPEQLV